MRFGMAIDINRCIGCHTCAVACKLSNNLPNEVWWNCIRTDGNDSGANDAERGSYTGGDLYRMYYPVTCQQCSNPACVAVCPTGASYVREEDGIIAITTDACIGCASCIAACPYDVRRLLDTEPQYSVEFPVGDINAPKHVVGTVGKCTGCTNLTDRGEVPACMDLCPARARHWGDLDDPSSDISQFLSGRTYERLNEAAGTEPNCYYVK